MDLVSTCATVVHIEITLCQGEQTFTNDGISAAYIVQYRLQSTRVTQFILCILQKMLLHLHQALNSFVFHLQRIAISLPRIVRNFNSQMTLLTVTLSNCRYRCRHVKL